MPGSSSDLPVLAAAVCPGCGRRSYHPVGEPIAQCPVCGKEPQVVDTFRDRRRVPAPVKRDRRRPTDPDMPLPGGGATP
jgi:ribosomal protein L37AE/L43A